jgi:hypothetical protein
MGIQSAKFLYDLAYPANDLRGIHEVFLTRTQVRRESGLPGIGQAQDDYLPFPLIFHILWNS